MADTHGRPVALCLTPGNVADISIAIPIMEATLRPKRLLADRAYDADSFRFWLKARQIIAVIPSTASRNRSYPLDMIAERRRNIVERLFGWLKTGNVLLRGMTASPETSLRQSR